MRCAILRSVTSRSPMRNPFEFGRELSASELADRVDEVEAVRQVLVQNPSRILTQILPKPTSSRVKEAALGTREGNQMGITQIP